MTDAVVGVRNRPHNERGESLKKSTLWWSRELTQLVLFVRKREALCIFDGEGIN